MICCENVVKILWTQHFFFNSSPDFSNHYFIFYFFPPIFSNAIATIDKKKNLFPYFDNGIATIRFLQFFFLPISAMPLLQINCHFFFLRNDMCTPFLQQILNGRLLLVVIVGLKK